MKILVLNSGSSSIKYQVFEFNSEGSRSEAKGIVERIGQSGATITCARLDRNDSSTSGLSNVEKSPAQIKDHHGAIALICKSLLNPSSPIIGNVTELSAIGHRVVHGGEEFYKSVLIDKSVLTGIERCARLAPLHNPPAIMGIKACTDTFGAVPQVAVFDTAFHHTIPRNAYLYPIPYAYYQEHAIRKYGFHGTSHRYVALEAARYLGKPIEETRLITCHLGNGCSVTAINRGKSIDTSMGMTPLGGVMMGTRSGDMDPYIPLYMIREMGLDADEVTRTLNRSSGMEGICKHTDVRDIERLALEGDESAQLALDMFAYRIALFIGGYAMALGGADAIVFTGGIGENDAAMRSRILAKSGYLGIHIDEEQNSKHAVCIASPTSTAKALVIRTNEELMIARDTAAIIEASFATAALVSTPS
ncbi:MAG: acetate kinase [Candidatus Hydrogenedentota bacterium]